MAGAILIAQIGKGAYRNTKYVEMQGAGQENRKLYTTGYTFEAVLNQIAEKGTDINTVFLVGTEDSYWGSLCSYYGQNSVRGEVKEVTLGAESFDELKIALPEIADKIENTDRGYTISDVAEDSSVRGYVERYLGKILSEKFERTIQIKVVIIKPGIDELQLQENFQTLRESIENTLRSDKDNGKNTTEIYFDISNGFRSIPVYIYTLVNYLTRIHRSNFELFMYYGMADAKMKTDEGEIAPLVDLKDINELMIWINAVSEFRNYGSVKRLVQIFEKHREWDIKIDKNYTLSQLFQAFEYATNVNHLNLLNETTAIICSLDKLDEIPESENLPRQAKPLFGSMAEEFSERFGGNQDTSVKYSYLTIKLAEWFYEQGRIGNAAVALQEGILTYIMEKTPRIQNMEEEQRREYIFEYDNRKPVKESLEKYHRNKRSEFGEKYDLIRNRVRNPNAHILWTGAEREKIAMYNSSIKDVIGYMITEVNGGTSKIHTDLERHIKNGDMDAASKEEFTKIIFNLKKEDLEKLVGEKKISEKIGKVLCTLKKEIKEMDKLAKNETHNFHTFMKEKDTMEVLPEVLDQWIKSNSGQLTDETYRRYFSRKEGKLGSDRMLGYCSTRSDILREIAEKIK